MDDLDETGPAEEGAGGDLLTTALERYEAAYSREQENIQDALEDVTFAANLDDAQWPAEAKAAREAAGRPILSFNMMPQFARQVTGDIRQMRPAIKVAPVDDSGDPDTAEVLANLIRYVEVRSKAQSVYFKAADSQVRTGAGAWRVTREYASSKTFAQEIRIRAIEDALGVLWDPDAIEQDRSDARFCFVAIEMSRAGFVARYGEDKVPEDWGHNDAGMFEGWYGEDYVRVAEYWELREAKRTLLMLPNGAIWDLTDAEDSELADAQAIVQRAMLAGQPARIEERDGFEVWRSVITNGQVLEEPTRWPGSMIPIVSIWGEETRIGRKVIRHGIFRHAKDAQTAYNVLRCHQVEAIGLQPRAPWLVTEGMVEQYEDEWEDANNPGKPYLRYTPDSNAPGLKPERIQPPTASEALHEGVELAAGDIKATIGIYDAGLGAKSNETSGKAIALRQKEGDVGTFVYVQNFTQGIQRTGEIILDLVPHCYDTQRTVQIMGDNGKLQKLELNKPQGLDVNGRVAEVLNDVTVGAYDVVLETGPSYSTRRQEATDGMTALMQASPETAQLFMDLFVKGQDWPMAQEIAERFEAVAPPAIQNALRAERGEPPLPPPPPSPAEQAAAAEAEFKKGELALKGRELDLKEAELRDRVAERQAATLAPPAPAQPAPDPRVDALGEQVQILRGALTDLVSAVHGLATGPGNGPAAPPGPAEPSGPGAGLPVVSQPPPGGFAVSEAQP